MRYGSVATPAAMLTFPLVRTSPNLIDPGQMEGRAELVLWKVGDPKGFAFSALIASAAPTVRPRHSCAPAPNGGTSAIA
jgi:hypothetical protein